jgi:GNAT superfamily N-acetyltransferase
MKEKYLEQIQLGVKCTNSYWSSKEILQTLEKSTTLIACQSKALLFVEKTRYDFWRLYFYIQDITKINFDIFKEKKLVAEIIVRTSRKELWDTTIQDFEKKGQFKIYETFNRMYRNKQEVDIKDVDFSIIETASNEDMLKIRHLLETNFDVYSSKIPTLNELKILADTTFLIKDKGEIVAFFMTEKKGITLEFRYWLVLPKYRGRKFGKLLMDYVLTFDPEILRFTSWISLKNENVILAHKNLGFKEDGLTNYILYRE